VKRWEAADGRDKSRQTKTRSRSDSAVKFATLIVAVGSGLIVSAIVVAKFLPATLSIDRAPLALCIILGIALTCAVIVFAIHARQARVQCQARLDQIGQMTAVVVADAQGVITWVSERFTRVTGYQFEEALGRTPSQLLQGADTDRTEAMRIEAAVAAGQPIASELINYTKEGRAIWIGAKIQPMLDDRGALSGYIGIFADITERTGRHRALEHLTLRFNEATRAAHVGVFERIDSDGRLWWNEVMFEIFGENPFAFRPTADDWLAHVHPEDRDRVRESAGSATRARSSPSIQYRIIRPDGAIRHIQSIASIACEEGDPVRITGMVMDVTERVDAEAREQALQQQLLKRSHRAGMAEIAIGILHNVGNVLNSLGIASSTARRELKALRLDRLHEASSMIYSNRAGLATYLSEDTRGKHLPALLPALSAQLAANAQAVRMELDNFDQLLQHLREIVNTQQAFAQVGALRERIKLQELVEFSLLTQAQALDGIEVIRVFDDAPPVETERHKLLQILVNLISNARDAVRAGSASEPKRITVRLSQESKYAVLSVEDTGIGMSAEVISQLWEFGRTTKTSGHGFGLHNSANVAREIGATLDAQSDGPNRGSRFTLRLPIDPKSAFAEDVIA
jgi:PAS domain S-box-containing protein